MARPPSPSDDDAHAETSTRDRILDASEELFAAEGFDRTSTAQIARHAGVPNGLVFYYFPKKIDLLRTLVRERARVDYLLPSPETSAAGDVIEVVERTWRQVQSHLESRRRLRQIVFQELAAHSEVRDRIREIQEEGTRLLAAQLAEAAGHGTPQAVHQAAGRLLMNAAVFGSIVRGPDDPVLDPHILGLLINGGLDRAG